jgi:hypothetical protein
MALLVHRHGFCDSLSSNSEKPNMPADDRSLEQKTQQLLDEAEALIWGLLDENIDGLDFQKLEALMANEEVRKRYMQCVELHGDLQNLLSDDKTTKTQSPVLGSLGDSSLGNIFPNITNANVFPPLSE